MVIKTFSLCEYFTVLDEGMLLATIYNSDFKNKKH